MHGFNWAEMQIHFWLFSWIFTLPHLIPGQQHLEAAWGEGMKIEIQIQHKYD